MGTFKDGNKTTSCSSQQQAAAIADGLPTDGCFFMQHRPPFVVKVSLDLLVSLEGVGNGETEARGHHRLLSLLRGLVPPSWLTPVFTFTPARKESLILLPFISFPPPHFVLELNLFIQLLSEFSVCQ